MLRHRAFYGLLTATILLAGARADALPVGGSVVTSDQLAQTRAAMPAGSWKAIPNGTFSSAAYVNDTTCTYYIKTPCDYNATLASNINGASGPLGIFVAWSGGVLDTVGERLIVLGGGHSDYFGNEVYAFDFASLKWQRLNTPADPTGARFRVIDGRRR